MAKRQGFIIKKSRERYTYPHSITNFGGYMIVNADNNSIECGEKFDVSIDELEKFLSDGIEENKKK